MSGGKEGTPSRDKRVCLQCMVFAVHRAVPPPFVFLGFVRLALLTVFNERTKIKREIELHCTWPQSCTRRVTETCPW